MNTFIHTVQRRRFGITAVLLSLFLILIISTASAADITPGNPQGWAFGLESGTNGSGQFVTGPAAPPAGSGSAQLVVTNADTGSLLGLSAYGGTRLADIDAMSYWTYQTSASWSGMAPALQFNIDYDVTDAYTDYQGRLVFEPYRNGSPAAGVWQQWDAINSGNAVWWASRYQRWPWTPSFPPPMTPAHPDCTQSEPCTLTQLLNSYPNAGVHADYPGVGFKVGSGWANFDGSVDDFNITISGITDTYNFENLPVNNITQNTGHPTIQDAVDNANPGDVLVADPGTYAENVTIDKALTLRGGGAGTTVLDGSSLGTGTSGIQLQSGVTHVTIEDLTVQNYALSSSNYAGIAGAGGNDNLTVQRVQVLNNVGGRGGLYLNGPVDTVLIDNVTAHDNQGRGIVIWNGRKTNITITNNDARRNNCCGIELQDGTASGVLMSGNTAVDNTDSGMSAMGLTSGAGANLIANNTVTNNGRFGIEIKNPDGTGAASGDGSIVVENNTVSFTASAGMDVRDHGGIVVFRRSFQAGNPTGYADIPAGVIVQNNTVSGYAQQNPAATASEGFGIVIEGVNHTVTGNTLQNNDIGIQEQGGQHPHANYVPNDAGDGDQADGQSPEYFGRGNAPTACLSTISGNTFSGNTTDYRIRAAASGSSPVTNTDTGEQFCTIQTAIDDVDTLDGHTLQLAGDTYTESAITVHKNVTINGSGVGASIVDANGGAGFTVSTAGVTAVLQNMTLQNSSTAVSVSSGSVTVRGNALENHTAVFHSSGGVLTAYANNITNFTDGGLAGAAGTINGRHNWWGTYASQPAGVDNDSWAFRLGAPVASWADGAGSASLTDSNGGTASLTGGSGTVVLVNHNRPAAPADAPFGKAIAADIGSSQCSDFYDAFVIGGSGSYDLSIPVDAGCTNPPIEDKLFQFDLITATGAPNADACAPDTACWNRINAARAGSLLTASVPAADLQGTPFVAPSVNNNDPTAVTLLNFIPTTTSTVWPFAALLILSLITGFVYWWKKKI